MHAKRRLLIFLAAFALVPLSACDDDALAPVQNPGLEFSYAGDRSGSFGSDPGSPATTGEGLPEFGSWSVARPDSLGGLVIAGLSPANEDVADLFILQLDDIREGSFDPCGPGAGGGCHGRLFVGVVLDNLASLTFDEYFEIVDGSVSISEASATRIRGTFEATLENQDGSATITLADGVINVPFSSEVYEGGGIACLARNLQAGTTDPC